MTPENQETSWSRLPRRAKIIVLTIIGLLRPVSFAILFVLLSTIGCSGEKIKTGAIEEVQTNYEDGQIDEQYFVLKGSDIKHGPYTAWYKSGAKELEGSYSNGNKTGEWIKYHENGVKKTHGWFKNGEMDGRWAAYDEQGNTIESGEFNMGVRVPDFDIVRVEDFSHKATTRLNIVILTEPNENRAEVGQIIWKATNLYIDRYDIICLVILPDRIEKNSQLDSLRMLYGGDYYLTLALAEYVSSSKKEWATTTIKPEEDLGKGISVQWTPSSYYYDGR